MNIPLYELSDEQDFTTEEREYIRLEPQESQPSPFIALDHNNGHTAYVPTFLRRRVLVAFAIVFAGLFCLIQFLYSYSQQHQGISQSHQSRQYLWTFGPTAILVLIAVLWRQVDYAAKLILPWANMARGPCSADRSILLDYVSPSQVRALYKSLRNQDWLVSATILTFILLKILIIISTGLFALKSVIVERHGQEMNFIRSFDLANFHDKSVIDARTAFTVLGIQNLNLSYPVGTTERYAMEEFKLQGSAKTVLNYTAIVDVFSSSLDCEPGRLTYTIATVPLSRVPLPTDPLIEDPINAPQEMHFYNVSVSTSNCQIHGAQIGAYIFVDRSNPRHIYVNYPNSRIIFDHLDDNEAVIWGQMDNVDCVNIPVNDETRERVMFTVIHTELEFDKVGKVLGFSSVICNPAYAIRSASVTASDSQNILELVLTDRAPGHLPGISGQDIARDVIKSVPKQGDENSPFDLLMAFDTIQLTPPSPFLTGISGISLELDGFFQLVIRNNSLSSSTSVNYLAYLDDQVLKERSIAMYNMLATQVAGQYLALSSISSQNNSMSNLTGSVAELQDRLIVRELPLRLMEGILLVVLCLALFVSVTAPRGVAPRSPDSPAVLAAIFARNTGAFADLRDTGHLDLDVVRLILSRKQYWITVKLQNGISTFIIQSAITNSSVNHVNPNLTEITPAISWYRPLVFELPSKVSLLFMPIAIITALETTLRVSVSNFGIAAVDIESLAKYSWSYIPSIVLVLLGALFNVLDFTVQSLEPYHTLSVGYFEAKDGLLQYPLRNMPIYSAWTSLRLRSFASLASSVAVMFVPFLTITVSGLFYEQNMRVDRTVDIRVLNWFTANLTNNENIHQDVQSGIITSLIQYHNMSFPAWSYDELALPEISIQDNGNLTRAANRTELILDMPALRSVLNCTAIPQNKIFSSTTVTGVSSASLHYNFTYKNNPGPYGNVSFSGNETEFVESGYDDDWISDDDFEVPLTGYFGSFINHTSLTIMVFGQVSPNITEHFTALVCRPYVARIIVNAIFSLPDFSLRARGPPYVNESTAQIFSNWDNSLYQRELIRGFLNLNISTDLLAPFFQAAVFGKDGVPLVELKNNTKLISSLEHVFRQYTAQLLSGAARMPLSSIPSTQVGTPNDTWTGTVQTSETRLVQSTISTRLLESVLGVLLLCAVVVCLTMDARRVLPKPTYSIAAVASLLVGSRLLDEREGLFPPGVEWFTNAEWARSEIWRGELFHMGWWNQKDGTRRFGIDIKEKNS